MSTADFKLHDVSCPDCGARTPRHVAPVILSPYQVQSNLCRCLACGFHYVSPRPESEVTVTRY